MSDEFLEDAFLRNSFKTTINDGTIQTNLTSTNGVLTIEKVEDVDAVLQYCAQKRANFTPNSGKESDHYTHLGTIPRLVYDKLVKDAGMLGITDKKEVTKFIIEKLKTDPVFQPFLCAPANYRK